MKEIKKRLSALTKEILSGKLTTEELEALREEVRTLKELILAHKAAASFEVEDDDSLVQKRTSGDFTRD